MPVDPADRHFRPRDTEEEKNQIRKLVRDGHPVQRKSEWHLKIGEVNYYFPKGRIVIDPAVPQGKGFDQLLRVLNKQELSKIS